MKFSQQCLLSLYLSIGVSSLAVGAGELPPMTYEGYLTDASGTPKSGAHDVKVKIYSSAAASCLLYESAPISINASSTDGYFVLRFGESTSTYGDLFTSKTKNCLNDNSSTNEPATALGIEIWNGSAYEAMNDLVLFGNVAYALRSEYLGDKPASAYVAKPSSCASHQVLKFDGTGFICAEMSLLSTTQSTVTGSLWYDSINNNIKFYDGTSVKTLGEQGSVTGDAITSGTISGSTAINSTGNIQTTGTIQASGTITGSSFSTTGAISGSSVNVSGAISSSSVSANYANLYTLKLSNGDANKYLALSVPTDLPSAYSLKFPSTDGSTGQVLSTDGVGNLNWKTVGATTVTANRALISDASGIPTASAVTSTELGYLAGISSSVQGQMNSKADLTGRSGGQTLNGGVDAGEDLTLESTAHATKGNVIINPSDGKVGVGVPDPVVKLDVNGSIKFGYESIDCVGSLAGAQRYNSGTMEYCNGVSWNSYSAGGGIASINSQTGVTQSLALGFSGTVPNWSSSANVHTLNIPMASVAGVTAGLISQSDYEMFTGKLDSASVFSGDVSGTSTTLSVGKIRGIPISGAGPGSEGQVLRYDGLSYEPAFLSLADIRSELFPGNTIFPETSCLPGKSLNWSSLTDTFTCQSITITDSQVTFETTRSANTFLAAPNGTAGIPGFRALVAADLPGGGYDSSYAKLGGNTLNQPLALGTSDFNPLRLLTNNTTQMIVTETGDVGIGTTAPGWKLDVAGDVNIAGGSELRFSGISVCTSGGCTSASDERLKENIEPLEGSLEKILQLRGVEYDYRDKIKFGASHQIGLIAQDVEKLYPEVVKTDAKIGFKSVAYDHLVAPLIEAVKSLYKNMTALEAENALRAQQIQALQQENREMKARLERLEKMLEAK